MTTGLIFDREFLLHEQSPSHPERRERLSYTIDQIEEEGLFHHPRIRVSRPPRATREQVERVHYPEYVRFLEEASRREDSSTSTRWSQEACLIVHSLQQEALCTRASRSGKVILPMPLPSSGHRVIMPVPGQVRDSAI